jgi:lipopolysaccharide export system permease protein
MINLWPVTIVQRYLLKEFFLPFVVNIAFFSFVFLMTQILEITNMVVNYNLGLFRIVLIMIYTLPFFLEFVIPMSVMLSVLLTFLKLSADNEITALKAGGIGLYQLLPSVIVFSTIGGLLTATISLWGLPWGQTNFKRLAVETAQQHLDAVIKERTFNDAFKGVMLYVSHLDTRSRLLTDVFIEDQRTPNIVTTVVAPSGNLLNDVVRSRVVLRLYNGMINQVDVQRRSVNTVQFSTYDITLDLKQGKNVAMESGDQNPRDMYFPDILRLLRETTVRDTRYYKALMEFHKKFALPFACLVMGLLATPLGIQFKSARRSYGIALGLGFFLLYYILLSAGLVFGETGLYPPVIGMWLPDLVMGGIAAYLMVRVAQERPIDWQTPLLTARIWLRNHLPKPGKSS